MTYINFNKEKLINLSYSLDKELLRTNRRGSYASSTLIKCNTRKYHGLLICPQPNIDNELHVLLSSIDPTIIQHREEFNLGIHQYPNGVFIPKGHKYVNEVQSDPIPKTIYRIGGVLFSIETIFSKIEDRVLLRYTLIKSNSDDTIIRLKPYLAFRQVHQLSKANEWANKKYEVVENGVTFKMYQGYSNLYLQFSKKVDYVHVPDWYYNIEYIEEQRRGYDFQEDLFVPGYFEFKLKKGESIILSAGLNEIKPSSINKIFNKELTNRIPRDSFEHCLSNSAEQFIYKRDNKTEIVAGFPWFGRWSRDTFVALPGLAMAIKDNNIFKDSLISIIAEMNGSLFPNYGSGKDKNYGSVDAPLWFFWSVQQYLKASDDIQTVEKKFYKKMLVILEAYRIGTDFNIHMTDDKLIWAGEMGKALTWMDAVVDGKPITPRIGKTVEVNALWYNAVMFTLEIATKFDDKKFIEKWKPISEEIPISFKNTFWNKDKGYLADYVNGDFKDWAIRPNMIFATSLPYCPISIKIRELILSEAKNNLLTNRGLRSLSPIDLNYKGICEGNTSERDAAYHQGTVWPWLFGHFAEGYLKVHGKAGIAKIQWYFEQFQEVMTEHGIGSISEIYDGDPPHKARGCISQAWSVAEIYRANEIIKKYLNTETL